VYPHVPAMQGTELRAGETSLIGCGKDE
jgi:hypothetical protein